MALDPPSNIVLDVARAATFERAAGLAAAARMSGDDLSKASGAEVSDGAVLFARAKGT